MARVEAGMITPTELPDILRKTPGLVYAILERRLVLDRKGDLAFRRYVEEEDYRSWDKGQIFGPLAEVRWVRQANQLAVVVCGEFPEMGLPHRRDLNGLTVRPAQYYLWGIRTEGKQEWLELRIPRTFAYPLQTSQPRMKLVLYEYYHGEDGALEFYRFADLQDSSGEEEYDACPV